MFEGAFRNFQPYGHGTLHLPHNTTYTGDIDQGQPHGTGVFTYANNKTFSGEFTLGQVVSGSGYFVLSNQDAYEGTIVDGQPQGHGSYTIHPRGDVMCGEFVNGSMVTGRLNMSAGGGRYFYEGDWQNNEFHGQGELSNRRFHYKGQFSKGKMHGTGTVKFLQGPAPKISTSKTVASSSDATPAEGNAANDVTSVEDASSSYHPEFTGEFRGGQPYEGSGYFRTATYSFNGTYTKGKKNGEGVLYHKDGEFQQGLFEDDILVRGTKGRTRSALKYTGTFDKDGKLFGPGKIVMIDGFVLEGEFKEGNMLSPGKITYRDKSVYEGEHEKLVRQGQGVFTATNGSVYTGGFSQDDMHGEGVLVYADGRKVEGTFQKGRLINGCGVLMLKDGGSYEGEHYSFIPVHVV